MTPLEIKVSSPPLVPSILPHAEGFRDCSGEKLVTLWIDRRSSTGGLDIARISPNPETKPSFRQPKFDALLVDFFHLPLGFHPLL